MLRRGCCSRKPTGTTSARRSASSSPAASGCSCVSRISTRSTSGWSQPESHSPPSRGMSPTAAWRSSSTSPATAGTCSARSTSFGSSHGGRDLRARPQTELLEYAREVGLDHLLAEVEAAADLPVGQSLGDEAGNFALALAECDEAGAPPCACAAPARAGTGAAKPPARLVGAARGAAAHRLIGRRSQLRDRRIAIAGEQRAPRDEPRARLLERGSRDRRL